MCNATVKSEEKKTVYNLYERKDYGRVTSIDIDFKFIKEFLNAQMYVDMGLQSTGDQAINEKNQQLWTEKVKPFFDHVEEILNTL